MESPNAIWVEYLLQLKKNADEKGFAREKIDFFIKNFNFKKYIIIYSNSRILYVEKTS